MAQDYNQQEGIDYDETFALVARLEAIRMLLAYAAYKGFVLYQRDVKSTFLNGFIFEEVYVKQPPSFEMKLFLIMFSNFQKLHIVWYKLQEIVMKDLALFFLKMVLKEEKLTLPCLSCMRNMISWLCKFM